MHVKIKEFKNSRIQEFKNSRIQEWCDAELGARSLDLLELAYFIPLSTPIGVYASPASSAILVFRWPDGGLDHNSE